MYRDLPSSWLLDPARLEVCCHWYAILAQNLQHPLIGVIDIDPNNIRTAQQNVALNGLESRIRIMESSSDGPLFPLEKLGHERCVPSNMSVLQRLSLTTDKARLYHVQSTFLHLPR